MKILIKNINYQLIFYGITFCVISAFQIIMVVDKFRSNSLKENQKISEQEDVDSFPPPSSSKLRVFENGAVCSDGAPCALIGKSILNKNGSAVDAAIATLLCNGLVNMQSMGLGGGFFMTIYKRDKKQAFDLNARESAPFLAHSHMFDGKRREDTITGSQAINVPGELAGYWAAHQRFGQLPWQELFIPTIELCENGYELSQAQFNNLFFRKDKMFEDPILKQLFVDPETNDFKKPGSIIKPKKLCETLKIISEEGAGALYNGTLGESLISDITKKGGIMTLKDLNSYRAKWEEPVSTKLANGMTVFTNNIPGSGSLVAMILNVFDKFKFTPNDMKDDNSIIKTYHRMIETFKFAYAVKTEFGDKNLTELINKITSKEFAESVYKKINDSRTYNDRKYYEAKYIDDSEDHGTAHTSVIAPNGDAVTVTSSINVYFGSCICSESTGIVLNDGMADFRVTGLIMDEFGPYNALKISTLYNLNNDIEPGKRPVSSMSPTILTDSNGEVKMAIGAAGGSRIISAVAYVLARNLWLGDSIKEAIDSPRIHHNLDPMKVLYEFGVPKKIINGLKKLGHETERYKSTGFSIICALEKINDTIIGNADYRKGGDVY